MATFKINETKTGLQVEFNGASFKVANAKMKALSAEFNATFETAYTATTAFDSVLNEVVAMATSNQLTRLEAGKLASVVFGVDSMTKAFKGETDDIKAKNKFIESRWLYVSRIQIPTAAQLKLNPNASYLDISKALNNPDFAELKAIKFSSKPKAPSMPPVDSGTDDMSIDIVANVTDLAENIAKSLPKGKALELMLALFDKLDMTAEECEQLSSKVKPQAPTTK